jgi:mono/diheme cytochrome c family protein
MKTYIAGMILGVTAAPASCPHGPRTGNPVLLPLDGAKTFRSYCAACHGIDGKGHGPVAGALRHAPPDLTLILQRNGGKFPADKVRTVIAG